MSVTNYQDSIDQIKEFLNPVRMQAQKEAADSQEMPSSPQVSFKDTAASTPQALAQEAPANTEQNNLGREQSAEAKAGGMNIETVAPNNEADAQNFADDQGPQTLDSDQKIMSKGNLGTVRKQEITQEQKTARAELLGNSILQTIEKELTKQASCAKKGAKPAAKGNAGEHGDDYATAMGEEQDKEASIEDMPPEFQYALKVANAHAEEYRDNFLYAMLKRAQDEAEVLASVSPEVLEKVGGVEALLDKIAMETPEAVLPEGADIGALAGDEAAMGAAPEMGAPEMGAEGGGDLESLVAALEEAGVSPEELQQAFEDVQALQDAGVKPEELAQALSELTAESEVAGEGATGAEPVPEEVPAVEEKMASDHTRIDQIKQFLSQ